MKEAALHGKKKNTSIKEFMNLKHSVVKATWGGADGDTPDAPATWSR